MAFISYYSSRRVVRYSGAPLAFRWFSLSSFFPAEHLPLSLEHRMIKWCGVVCFPLNIDVADCLVQLLFLGRAGGFAICSF